MIKVIRNQENGSVSIYRTNKLVSTFTEGESKELAEQLGVRLNEEKPKIKEPDEYLQLTLRDILEEMDEHSYNWEDIKGIDFCVTRMEHSYPGVSKEAKLLFNREMKYKNIKHGHEYERDFDWFYPANLEENFYKEEVWDIETTTLEKVLNCISRELLDLAIESDFEIRWDGELIQTKDIQTFLNEEEIKNNKEYYFGSNYDT